MCLIGMLAPPSAPAATTPPFGDRRDQGSARVLRKPGSVVGGARTLLGGSQIQRADLVYPAAV